MSRAWQGAVLAAAVQLGRCKGAAAAVLCWEGSGHLGSDTPRLLPPSPLPPCRHLDADEAPVLGAALFGANLSTTFRLRQFGLADKTPFSVAIKLDVEEGGCWFCCSVGPACASSGEAAGGVAVWDTHDASLTCYPLPALVPAAPKTLVPAMRKMPTKRAVHLHNLTVDAMAFGLDFDNAPGAPAAGWLAGRCAARARTVWRQSPVGW